jgi:hypothetical protein
MDKKNSNWKFTPKISPVSIMDKDWEANLQNVMTNNQDYV